MRILIFFLPPGLSLATIQMQIDKRTTGGSKDEGQKCQITHFLILSKLSQTSNKMIWREYNLEQEYNIYYQQWSWIIRRALASPLSGGSRATRAPLQAPSSAASPAVVVAACGRATAAAPSPSSLFLLFSFPPLPLPLHPSCSP
jgi:hypothetical protein